VVSTINCGVYNKLWCLQLTVVSTINCGVYN